MALPPDLASLILLEIGKELQFYEDSLAMIGLLYVGKVTVSFSLSLYRGFREHVFTKLYPNKELIQTYGPWAGKHRRTLDKLDSIVNLKNFNCDLLLNHSCNWSY